MRKSTTINYLIYAFPLMWILSMTAIIQFQAFELKTQRLSNLIIVDLLLTTPLVYYLIIRKRDIPKVSVIFVFIICLIAAIFIIPEEHQSLLRKIRFWGLPILEILFFTYIIIKAKKVVTHLQTDLKDSINSKMEVFLQTLNEQKEQQENQLDPEIDMNKVKITDLSDFMVTNLKSEADWKDFVQYFSIVHKDFFKNLKNEYPNITSHDLNLCALIKLNLLNNEIAKIMGISTDSVRKAQYRLSKKMGVKNIETLRNLILKY